MAPILNRAGLTADADLVYRMLVSFGQTSSGRLAAQLRLSHGRVLTALSNLHTAGLVNTDSQGINRRWSAATSAAATSAAATSAAATSAAATSAAATSAATSAAVTSAVTGPKDRQVPSRPAPYPDHLHALVGSPVVNLGDDLRHLTSRPATQHRLDEVYARGPRHLLTINPEQRWDDAALRAGARASHWIVKNRIEFREIGSHLPDPDILLPYGGLRLPKDTFRRLQTAPMKLIIIDRQLAFFPVDPGNFERGYLEVSQAPIVESLLATFEKYWADAEKPMEAAMNTFQLSPREEAIVEQLVLGHTDATAARALHISERTVSSILRSLMERLDVRNRFQLGVALGKLDAAPSPPPAGRTLPAGRTAPAGRTRMPFPPPAGEGKGNSDDGDGPVQRSAAST